MANLSVSILIIEWLVMPRLLCSFEWSGLSHAFCNVMLNPTLGYVTA